MKVYRLIVPLLFVFALSSACQETDTCDAVTCDTGQHCVDGVCVKDEATDKCKGVICDTGEHCVDGVCVKDEATDKCKGVICDTGEHCDDGVCVKDEVIDKCKGVICDTGEHCDDGVCVKDEVIDKCATVKCTEGAVCIDGLCVHDKPIDPCKGIICLNGVCDQGVCVTQKMKDVEELSFCDPERFVEFCDGDRTVYCDNGFVAFGICDEGCVVYDETYFGRRKQSSGCIDGGKCYKPNELVRSCSMGEEKNTVFAKACQLTANKTLAWVSVDGYYCSGACDAAGEKCDDQGDACDPYEYLSTCDGAYLKYCYLDGDLIAQERTRYCENACISVDGQKTCGYPCDKIGERRMYCQGVQDPLRLEQCDYICSQSDTGELYSVWTGQYEICTNGCDGATGMCK